MCSVDDNGIQPVATTVAATYRSAQKPRRVKGVKGEKGLTDTDQPSMATRTTASCTGSTLLQPISEIINLPLDQVCFWMYVKWTHEPYEGIICSIANSGYCDELADVHERLAKAADALRCSSQTLA